MIPFHAVVFVDHHSAQLLQFASQEVVERKIHDQLKFTRQHQSGARTEHEFFGDVCDAFAGVAEVLVVGGHAGLADFRHYVEKHRPRIEPFIVGYGLVDHPTEKQLVAMARRYFSKYEPMAGLQGQA